MANPTFSWVPSIATRGENSISVYETSFGDGYKQRVASGINNQRMMLTAVFTNRLPAEIRAIDAFLRAMNGVRSFQFSPPSPWNFSDAAAHVPSDPYTTGAMVKAGSTPETVFVAIADNSDADLSNADHWVQVATLPLKFICKRGDWSIDDVNNNSLTATFEQVFEEDE